VIARKRIWRKKTNTQCDFERDEFDIIESGPDGKPNKIDNENQRERLINSFLPETVKSYFLFDGEKIDEFSKMGKEDEIKTAIRDVLGLTSFTNLNSILDSVINIYRKELRNIGDKSKEKDVVNAAIESYEQEIIEKEENLKSLKKEKFAMLEIFDQINKELASYSEKYQSIEKRKSLEIAKKRIELVIIDKEKNASKYVSPLANVIGTIPLLTAQKYIHELRGKKKIPTTYTETLIDDIFNDKYCICERPVEKNSKEAEVLLNLKKEAQQSSKYTEEVLDLLEGIPKIIAENSTDFAAFRSYVSSIYELSKELDDIENNLDSVNVDLEGINEERILELNNNRKKTNTDIDQQSATILREEGALNEKRKELDGAYAHLEKLEIKKPEVKKIKQRIDLTARIKEAVEKLYISYAEDKRVEIEGLCSEIFKKLLWKQAQYTEVSLNEKYELDVQDRYGTSARRDFSAGERELLSLAFITAMAKSSGKEAPFVIDTPFARISKKPRDNIAEHLPEQVSQMVLFVTDVELTPESEKLFTDRAG
jgi:DNA sulfur modification protein DndD